MKNKNHKYIFLSFIATLSFVVGSISLYFSLTKNKSGESAFEVAVRNGFEGTEQEWLDSLKGDKGNKGENGEPGLQGEKGEPGENGKSVFVEFVDTFSELNEKLITIDKTVYKTPFDRFSELDIEIEDLLMQYKTFRNYFYYSLKDNQFVLIDLTNYLLNDNLIIYNTTTSYKKGNNFPTKSVDLFKFVYGKEKPSSNYSNYLTLDYNPIGYINDRNNSGLVGYQITISTGLDIGSRGENFIVRYNRENATSGQQVLIRSGEGVLGVNSPKDTVYYYGDATLYHGRYGSAVYFALDFEKLYINDVEIEKPESQPE